MNPQTILLYDGTFDGFLCSVFMAYEQKISAPIIRKKTQTNNQLFTISEQVVTQKDKAERVWNGFKKKTNLSEQRDFFKAFLSEIKGVENTLLSYMRSTFTKETNNNIDFSNKDILKISQVARMVGREKHRMEAFVRFQLIKDGLYVATVSPDFNVLPLITHHFKDRYADQKWLIFDTARKYGIYYDLHSVEIVTFENLKGIDINTIKNHYANQEVDSQKLWSTYYENVNIKSRKNTKLHHQHLPKRYWKYLIEKNTT
ncbi:TIGR03915 family putative DNA repair protein [Aquimarina gracilis]|uniref:TIGR03915 family putative DNA repair protein n=1 Tax=Aquimarina gracilis TaxID=874422 RepID=A0ABU5ZQU4_9FLAO|nr:TIGR03915 family putative DNA repair protein [Aquimarina gracilis]MEB3344028.1 TIGR03915 family putative DNA repair protein [Aquimarina gracilis]